jgi:hypothetical protein
MITTKHALYALAEQADARLTEVLKSRTGRDRWTMQADDYMIPEVADALRAKMNADEAWLAFLRTSRNRTAAKPVEHDWEVEYQKLLKRLRG